MEMFCVKMSFPALPQSAKPVTEKEEDEEEDDKKIGKLRVRKICSSGNAKIPISLKGIARGIGGFLDPSCVFLRLSLLFPGE